MFVDGRGFFERPSIPQTGWMGEVPLSLFEGNLFSPADSQSDSFRVFERLEDQSFSVLDQPQAAWITFVVPPDTSGGGGGGWWGPGGPPGWYGPWYPGSYSDNLNQQTNESYRVRDREDQFRLFDQPVSAALFYQAVFIPGGGGGWWPPGWWGPWFPEEAVPLLEPLLTQLTESFRVWDEPKGLPLDQPPAPIWKAVLNLWEPYLSTASSAQLQSFRANEEGLDKAHVLQPPPNLGWIFVAIPPDIIFTQTALSQLTNSFTFERVNDNPLVDQPINAGVWKKVLDLLDDFLFAGIRDQALSYRPDEENIDPQLTLQTTFTFSWAYDSLPGTPFVVPALQQLLNSFRVEKLPDDPIIGHPVQVAVVTSISEFFDAFLYVSIYDESRSFRVPEEQIDKRIDTRLDPGWIFNSVPPAVVFDPALWPPIGSQARVPELREPPEGIRTYDTFSQGWIFYQVPVGSADTQHELLGAVRTTTITINPNQAIPIDLNVLFGFVTANDYLVCTNLTIESLN